jgi:hypothetical protein
MTYNKEELLDILENLPLYEGKEFHSGDNDILMDNMSQEFNDSFYYAYGASKFVLIPFAETDYVIKIPYTGSYNKFSGFYDDNRHYYFSGSEEYCDYQYADSEEREWDYCESEAERYLIAEQAGLERCFAKTEFFGYSHGYPVYIQERCITFGSKRSEHTHSQEQRTTTKELCKYYNISIDWLTDFRLYYGKDIFLDFIDFIKTKGWDDDLRNENIGYIGDRPVLIDYSGFLEC